MRGTVDTGWRLGSLALAWVSGVALHLQQAALWPLGLCIVASAIGAMGLSVAWRWHRAIVVGLLGAALLACGVSGWRAAMVMADGLPSSLEGQDIDARHEVQMTHPIAE